MRSDVKFNISRSRFAGMLAATTLASMASPALANWGAWQSTGGILTGPPSCVSWAPSHIRCLVRGLDSALYLRWWDGNLSGGWDHLGGVLNSAPSCVSWGRDHVECFVEGSDRGLHYRWWGGWQPLGGIIKGKPSCISLRPGHLDCFAQGDDNGLHHRWRDENGWAGWEGLGGTIKDPPHCKSWGIDHIDCFVRGGDDALHYRRWNGSTWLNWQTLGGTIKEAPRCISLRPGHIDCFARGSDDAMHHRWWNGTGWMPWESLGGAIKEAPECLSWGPSRIDCLARGSDDAMYHRWWDGVQWQGWQRVGGIIKEAPSCVSLQAGTIDCFARGADDAMWRISFNQSTTPPGSTLPAPQPLPVPLPAASLTGYQVVESQPVTVGVGRSISVSAVCPTGKVALSAGYRFIPKNSSVNQAEVERALEVKQARPVWPGATGQSFAHVEMRNAHALQEATVAAIAVCIDFMSGMRIRVFPQDVIGSNVTNRTGFAAMTCGAGEVVIGGGVSTMDIGHIKANGPDNTGSAWATEVIQAGFGVVLFTSSSVVCAPAASVPQWSIADSGPVALPGVSEVTQTVRCPDSTRVLAAGILDATLASGIDMITTLLAPSGTSSWQAKVHNRNIIGAANSVVVQTRAICAAATP